MNKILGKETSNRQVTLTSTDFVTFLHFLKEVIFSTKIVILFVCLSVKIIRIRIGLGLRTNRLYFGDISDVTRSYRDFGFSALARNIL